MWPKDSGRGGTNAAKRSQGAGVVRAQAAVDREHQVLVAADVTHEPNDKKQWVPMLKQANRNVGRGRKITKASADNGILP